MGQKTTYYLLQPLLSNPFCYKINIKNEMTDNLSKKGHTVPVMKQIINWAVMGEGIFSRVIVFKLTTEKQPRVLNNIEIAQMNCPIKD